MRWCRRRRRRMRRCRSFRFSFASLKSIFIRERPDVDKAEKIYALLPKRDCGACGYENCYQCALAIAKGEAEPDACKVAGKRIKDYVERILSEV